MHRVALGSPAVLRATLQMEARKWEGNTDDVAPVFICGLARSGSTLLLNALVETGAFSTSTYRHMPFVLAPNMWSGKSKNHRIEATVSARAHADGMDHSFDSEEAFEEVFWRAIHGPQTGDTIPWNAKITKADLVKFQTFMTSVVKAGNAPRYLSKNNTNVTRIPALLKSAETAHVIIPFRHPSSFAGSTLAQHRMFLERDKTDKFAAQYMAWLGHHEFGPHFKPYAAPNVVATDTLTQDYLWSYWVDVYTKLLENGLDHVHFFNYDAFCESPHDRFKDLLAKIDIEPQTVPVLDKIHAGREYENTGVSDDLRARAFEIYARLVEK